jgi:hypothetical protein
MAGFFESQLQVKRRDKIQGSIRAPYIGMVNIKYCFLKKQEKLLLAQMILSR